MSWLFAIITCWSVSIPCQEQSCFSEHCAEYACNYTMSQWVIRGSMGQTCSWPSSVLYIPCNSTVYCVLCKLLYPQWATYQLPKDQMWPFWLFPLLPQSAWPTWKVFHERQNKVSGLKGLVHVWSPLPYNLMMSFILSFWALCSLMSPYFIPYETLHRGKAGKHESKRQISFHWSQNKTDVCYSEVTCLDFASTWSDPY